MKIKICGLKSLKDIEIINKADIDFGGFIFASESKRKIDYNLAYEMKKKLTGKIKIIGVFADNDIEFILKVCDIIDIIQLHGDESNNYIKELKQAASKKIIKAYRADNNLEYNINSSNADFILIDSFSGKNFGGTGKSFDWNLIPKTDKKIFLSGGLNIDNISDAITKVNPYCVDINSGVETNGYKDEKKISEIIKKIRSMEN